MSYRKGVISGYFDESDYEKLMTLALVAGKSPGEYLARRFSSRLTELEADIFGAAGAAPCHNNKRKEELTWQNPKSITWPKQ